MFIITVRECNYNLSAAKDYKICWKLEEMRMRGSVRKAAAVCAVLSLAAAGCGTRGGTGEQKTVSEDCTVTVLIRQEGSNAAGSWEGAGADKLYEDTGIHVEFYSNGSGDEKNLKQYLAAGTLPDLVGFQNLEQAELLIGADVLLPLDEYSGQLPEIFHNSCYEAAVQYYREIWGKEEKHLYFMATSIGERSEDEYTWMPMLQWNAYKKAGMPQIGTLEDYLNAAELMQKQKPTTPLGERVYGFSLCGDWAGNNQQPSSLSYFYGIDTGQLSPLMELSVSDGHIKAVTEENSFYHRALLFYFEANQRGLLDPDSRTQTAENLKRKYENGQILFANFPKLTRGYGGADERAADSYAAVPASDMKICREPDNPVGSGWYFGINKNSKDPETVCRLLNWLYDPENIRLLYSEESERVFSQPALTRAAMGDDDVALSGQSQKQPSALEEEILVWRGMSLSEELERNGQIQEESAAVYMADALPDAMQKKGEALQELITELSWDMIYAESQEAFESLWQKMIQKCETMGIKELKSYYERSWKTAVEREKTYGTPEE